MTQFAPVVRSQNGGLSWESSASIRGRSASNAMVEYCVVPFASGLVNRTGEGWSFACLRGSGFVRG